jgi:hypothetical protein
MRTITCFGPLGAQLIQKCNTVPLNQQASLLSSLCCRGYSQRITFSTQLSGRGALRFAGDFSVEVAWHIVIGTRITSKELLELIEARRPVARSRRHYLTIARF